MKFCEWKLWESADKLESVGRCGKPATRAANLGSGVYQPVCEEHYQQYKRLRKEAESRGDGVTQ